MCGYDPFYWYELELDRDYEEEINKFKEDDNKKGTINKLNKRNKDE